MITTEAVTAKTATSSTTQVAPINADADDEKMLAFAEVLRKLEAANTETVPILKRIEANTSLLKKLHAASSVVAGSHEENRVAVPAARSKAADAPIVAEMTKKEPRAIARRAAKMPGDNPRNPQTVITEPNPPHTTTATVAAPAESAKKEVIATARRRASAAPDAAEADNPRKSTPVLSASTVEEMAAPADSQETKLSSPTTPRRRTSSAKQNDDRRATATEKKAAPVGKQAPSPSIPSPAESGQGQRDASGRFVARKSKSQEAHAVEREKVERASFFKTLEGGMKIAAGKGKTAIGDNAGTMEEAAGRAAGGPLFDAAMEIGTAIDSIRNGDGIAGKIIGKIGERISATKAATTIEAKKAGDGKQSEDSGEAVADALKAGDKKDEKRHKELIKAILQGDKTKKIPTQSPNMIASRSMDFPGLKGGTKVVGKLGTLAMKAAPLLAVSMPVVLGAVAAGAVGAAAYSAVTGKSNIINELFKKLTGIDAGKPTKKDEEKVNRSVRENTEEINRERRKQGKAELPYDPVTGRVIPGAVATQSESGKGGAGTISAGKNDAGGQSYGTKQLASAGGMKSPVAQFVRQSGHAKEFEGLTPGTEPFNKKWKEIAAKDKNFGAEQDAYVAKTMSAPVITKAQQKGFAAGDAGIREALISQSVNHGPSGNKKIIAGATDKLVKQYGSVSAAPPQEQIDALITSRKSYVTRVADAKQAKAEKLRAKGNEKAAAKLEGEARQLRSMAGDGGRYDKEKAITQELSANGGIVAAPKGQNPVASIAPASPARKSYVTRVADAKQAKAEIAVSTATATTASARPPRPERMQPLSDGVERASAGNVGDSYRSGAIRDKMPPAGVSASPQMDKLIALMSKMANAKDDKKEGGFPHIKTEFDDTMLTLMAYDRV